ncbi:MAG: diguanylate cyclase [Pseudolabrys sp.]|nr:diguanylate cyclase [Pseudolabrys sp.]
MPKALAIRAGEVDHFSHDSTAAALDRLTALVEAQARTIREYEASVAQSRHIFEAASAAARLGVWECDLASEKLTWSNGTYDLFDVERGTPLVRERTLGFYERESLQTLQTVRSRALQERKGFTLDAALLTPKGNQRWIRIHAAIECPGHRPIKIFGIKQDITEEKQRTEQLRYLAEVDDMTGLANRNKFRAQLSLLCGGEPGLQARGALLLIDLDGFKDVNDTLGHLAGDECLKEAAQRLKMVCGKASIVARVGGDEFAVLLDAPFVRTAPQLADRIIAALSQPIERVGRRYQIGASVGIAALDGCDGPEAFRRADAALYAAKGSGRGTYRVFRTAGRAG